MPDASVQYSLVSASLFAPLFATRNEDPAPFRKSLRDTIIKAFHVPGFKINTTKKAECILDALFHQFVSCHAPSESFSFSAFLAHAHLKKSEVKALLIELLYGLYYGDVDLLSLPLQNPKQTVECLLMQLIADKASPTAIRRLLLNLTQQEILSLIFFAKKRYREGSYFIFQELEKICTQEGELLTLLEGVQRGIFDLALFSELLTKEPDISLHNLINALKRRQEEETQALFMLFQKTIPFLLTYPMRFLQGIEEMKVKGEWDSSMPSIPQEQVELETRLLKSDLQAYYANSYTIQDFRDFVSIFGLHDYEPVLPEMGDERTSLVEKIAALYQVFSNPALFLYIPYVEMRKRNAFFFAIVSHLQATCRNPLLYKEGVEYLSCAMATSMKELARLPGLPSVLKSIQTLADFLQKKQGEKIDLQHFPIFVFDQSSDEIFAKNSSFIKSLNRAYKSAIIHISQKEALQLAQKLDIAPLLDTTKTGTFGFGGARNCLFLLTAPLKHAYIMGKRSKEELLEISREELQLLFQQFVLGDVSGKSPGDTLFMFDDDMQVSRSNLFSGALFADECRDFYIECSAYQTGRDTKSAVLLPSLHMILFEPEHTFSSSMWSEQIVCADFSECYSKPKICINIPHGSEERHLRIGTGKPFILKLSHHLSGSRYPKKEIPTHSIVGLDEYLKKHLYYSYLIGMSHLLIDSTNTYQRCILPWNDQWNDKNLSMNFHSLREAFCLIASLQNQRELNIRFWTNVAQFFALQLNKGAVFLATIHALFQLDIDATLNAFQEKEPLLPSEKASLQKIGALYQSLQQDATIFWKFGTEILSRLGKQASLDMLEAEIEKIKERLEKESQMSFGELPLTNGFYLMVQALGLGKFQESVEKAVQKRDG